MYMIFDINGKRYKLQGMRSNQVQEVALHAMSRIEGTNGDILISVQSVLHEFADVFLEPTDYYQILLLLICGPIDKHIIK